MRNILIVSCLLLSWTLVAQNDSIVKYDTSDIEAVQIDQDDLQTYREDSAFNYEEAQAEDNWWTDFTNWFYNLIRRFFEWIFGVDNAEGFLALFFELLPYLLLALFLYLVIRFFVRSKIMGWGKDKRNPNVVSLSEDEHIIKNEDIRELIKEALSNQDYRLAIRYHYLYILQLLSERDIIDWQQQKTNEDYLNELSEYGHYADFGRATVLYDYIWYGEFSIEQDRYTKVETVFTSLQKAIAHD
ncbi:DUF4129 domain-containing protein [Flagellimonas marinaquae]